MKISIIKIGGNVIDFPEKLDEFLGQFAKFPGHKILVHGGGIMASRFGESLGVMPEMVDGRRITDKDTLDIVTMVYAGLINKNIIAKLQALHVNGIGMSGADGNIIRSKKRPVKGIDYGFVGDVKKVNHQSVDKLIEAGFTPVFCAITHDGHGQLLNTNADTITSQVAIGMSQIYETTIYYCFELNGVLNDINDKDSVIKHINSMSYADLLKEGIIAEGMLPKLENCFDALKNGVETINLGNTSMLTKENDNFTRITL